MSEAAATTPEPEPPRTLEEWIAVQCDLLARNLAATEEVKRIVSGALGERDRTELVMALIRQADIEGVMLDVDGHIRDAATVRTLEQMHRARQAVLTPVPEPEPAPRRKRGGHRKGNPAQRPLYPRALRGAVPLGAIGAAARHSWPAAHPVAASAIALSLAAGTAAVVPHTAATFGFGRSPATQASVPGWQTSASPMPLPSSSLIARSVTRPKPNTVTVTGPLTYAPAPPQGSYAPPSSDPVPQDSPPVQAQVAGALSVSTTTLDLTGSGAGTLTLSCTGGDCPWHVVAGGVLSADVRQGDLQDGGSVTVTLSVDPAALLLGGSGVVKVWPGDIEVAVSWAAPPVQLPTDVPSVLPSALPTVAGA